MEIIIKAVVVYLLLLLVFRISGKRSLAQLTAFDFVLLLIISEVIQQALLVGDNSLTRGMVLVMALVSMDILISLLKRKSHRFEKVMDSVPLILVDRGKPHPERMRKSRVDEDDILNQARVLQGLERMDQVKYAVLERSGGISIIPWGPGEKPGES